MEEDLKVSEDYKKWFNRGYELRKTMPEVFKGMTTPEKEPKEITQAFEAGARQFEKDHGIDREKEELRGQYKGYSKENDTGMRR